MQGAITNIDNLREWYFANATPFFGLRYFVPGKAGETIMRNESEADMSAAWEKLSREVLSQAANGRALLQVYVYEKTPNNYKALTNMDIRQGGLSSMPQVAGIGGLQPGFIGKDELETIKAELREKWDMERRIDDLQAAIEAPKDWTESFINGLEKMASNPLGIALISKLTGTTVTPEMMRGTPATDDAEPSDSFEDDIQRTASILGVSDIEMAAKLRRMVEQNPDMARQILMNP